MHDQRAEIPAVEQRVAHHLGVGDAGLAVGEGDRAGALQEADLGHLLAFETLGQGRQVWTLTMQLSRARRWMKSTSAT